MTAWLVLGVVGVTLGLILARPRGVSEAWIALGGAGTMLLVGGVGPHELPGIVGETADVLLFVGGMMLLSGIVDRAGIFDLLAEGCARLARGSTRRLYVLLFLLGAGITAILSLDVTVIMLTPIVHAVTRRRGLDPLPFMFACAFVANTASLALPVSNLTNLLLSDALDLPFGRYVELMWLPNLVALLANLAIFLWLFRERLPRCFDPLPAAGEELPRVAAPRWRGTAAGVLGLTLLGLVGCGGAGVPLWWASLSGALVLAGLAMWQRRLTLQQAARDISWPLAVFVVGMTVLVRGVEHAWLADVRVAVPETPGRAIMAGVLAGAFGSNVINNVPMAVLARPVLETLPGSERMVLACAVLVGTNIGPALTTYGSLATMLWLTLARRRGIDVTTASYLRVSLATVPPVLLAAAAALWVSAR